MQAALSTGFESSEKRSQFTSKNGYSDDFGLAPPARLTVANEGIIGIPYQM